MAKFDGLEVYSNIFMDDLIPLFCSDDNQKARNIARALYKTVSYIFEFNNRGDKALTVYSYLLEEVSKECPDMVLLVVIVTDVHSAEIYFANSEDFIIGPNFGEEITKYCNKERVTYIPSAATVSEIIQDEKFRCELIKVFLGSTLGGLRFLKEMLRPLYKSKVMHTGGVLFQEESLKEWFEAGVKAIVMSSKLIKKEFLTKRDYKGLTYLVS
jgi:2-dehydro-3-deoxyphosphogluconate aldolase / (4S)-4-hydroxy-2-oxoglutarate aldolase